MVETFENAQFQIKMSILEHIPIHFWSKLSLMTAMILNFVEKSQIFGFEIWKCFWNFEIFGWWKIEIVMGGNSSHACKLEPDNSISIFAQTRLFLVKNEQSQKVRNHNVLLETKLDNDQKTFKWVLFY